MSLIHNTLLSFPTLIPYLYDLEEKDILKLPPNYFESHLQITDNIINFEYKNFYEYIILMNDINDKLQMLQEISKRENNLFFLLKDIKNRIFF